MMCHYVLDGTLCYIWSRIWIMCDFARILFFKVTKMKIFIGEISCGLYFSPFKYM